MIKNNNKNTKVNSNEVPTSKQTSNQTAEQWNPGQEDVKYVVTRGGFRVSDQEYIDPNYPSAISEMEFWKRVIKRFPDGTRSEIIQYDKKKHRIW